MKLRTQVVLFTFVHRPIQNNLFVEYYLLSTNHQKHPLNVLGVIVKSEMDSSDILKFWLQYEKNFPRKQELKQKGSDCKVTSYCLPADGQQLYWHTLNPQSMRGLLI